MRTSEVVWRRTLAEKPSNRGVCLVVVPDDGEVNVLLWNPDIGKWVQPNGRVYPDSDKVYHWAYFPDPPTP